MKNRLCSAVLHCLVAICLLADHGAVANGQLLDATNGGTPILKAHAADRTLFEAATDTREPRKANKYVSLQATSKFVLPAPFATPPPTAAPSAKPAGYTRQMPQGNLGVTCRLLLSAVISLLAVVFSLATLQQVRSYE